MAKYERHNAGLKLILAFKASFTQLIAIAVFFALGFTYFLIAHWGTAMWSLIEATIFVQTDATKDDPIATLYSVIGTIIITQGILTVIMNRVQQAFNPKSMAQILAQQAENHIIVLGFGDFGKLIQDWAVKNHLNIVIIDNNENNIRSVIEAGFPAVVENAADEGTLEMANVMHAHDVIQTFNDIRTALIVANKMRALNPKCDFWVRCHDDQIQTVLAEMGAKPFSTSAWIFSKLAEDLPPAPAKIAIAGYNNISERFVNNFVEENRSFIVIDKYLENVEILRQQDIPCIQGDPWTMGVLRKAGIDTCEAAIICIEDKMEESILAVRNMLLFNPQIAVWVRTYDDEIAEVIKGMGGHPFSSSRFAFEKLQNDLRR